MRRPQAPPPRKRCANELPRTMAPQLENMMHELTAQLSQEGAAQRDKHVEHFTSTEESLRTLLKDAEESVARLKAQAEEAESRLRAQAEIYRAGAGGSGAGARGDSGEPGDAGGRN